MSLPNSRKKIKLDHEKISSGNSGNSLQFVQITADLSGVSSKANVTPSTPELSCQTSQQCDNGLNQNSEEYMSGGIKNSQHGVLFQAKISFLLATKCHENGSDFKMAAELEAADKFDDSVVFLTEKNISRVVLVQAKHRLYPNKSKIEYQDLLKSDGDFSLIKYFLSYNKVIREPMFENKEKQFFICTTTSFNLTSFEDGVLSSPMDIDSEHIFYIEDDETKKSKGKMQKINKNHSLMNEFKITLQNTVLLQMKNNKKLLQLFDKDQKKKLFDKESITKEFIGKGDWNKIKNQINNILSGSTQNRTEKLEELLIIVDLFINEDDLKNRIESFLKNMIFITEYPDETQLSKILKHKVISNPEIKEIVDWMDKDLFYNSVEMSVLDWHHRYEDTKKKLAKFIFNESLKNLLNYWGDKCISMAVDSISRAETSKIKHNTQGIEFNNKFEELSDFLKSEEQVCCLKTVSKNPRLGTVKTLQHLTEPCSYIFTTLCSIKVDDLRRLILGSFSSATSRNCLLVIECSQEGRDKTNEKLICREINSSLSKNSRNKVIIISSTESSLESGLSFFFNIQHIDVNDDFKELTNESQNKILQSRVHLQGEEVTLKNIMDKTLASKIIDQNVLLDVLDGRIKDVGNKLIRNFAGCEEFCYIPRYFYQRFVFNNDTFGSSEKYIIAEINPEELSELGIEAKITEENTNFLYYDNGIVLHNRSSLYYNRSSYYNTSYWDYRYDKFVSINIPEGINNRLYYDEESKTLKKVVREEEFYKPALDKKALVITGDAGMGKSTVLSKLAIGIKKECQFHWVIRVNLNDFADKRNKYCLDGIDFEEHESTKAVNFLVDMIFRNDSSELQDFVKTFLKVTLDGQNRSKLKIIMLFDGFDEIVPAYKEKTIKLIKAVKASNVSQIIVTTRLSDMQYLEEALETRAWSLAPFGRVEQVQYLNRFLQFKLSPQKSCAENKKLCLQDYLIVHDLLNKLNEILPKPVICSSPMLIDSLGVKKFLVPDGFDNESKTYENKLENHDFSYYSLGLLEQWEETIESTGGQNNFLSYPLLLKMLAEVMVNREFEIIDISILPELYDIFIDMKFEVYKIEKNKQISQTQGTEFADEVLLGLLKNVHCMLALKMLFPNNSEFADQNENFKELARQFKDKNLDLHREISRMGIVTLIDTDNFQFVHRGFAEHYASKYICKYLGSRPGIQCLVINDMLSNKINFSVLEVIDSLLDKIKIKLSAVSDIVRADHLFAAIHIGFGGIAVFLLDCIKKQNDSQEQKASLLPKFIHEGDTVLHRTVKKEFFLELLHWFEQNLPQPEFRELLLIKNSSNVTFFEDFETYFLNHNSVLNILLVFLGSDDFVKQLILERDEFSKSILYKMFNNKYMLEWTDILDLIGTKLGNFSYLKELFILRDDSGNTLLHTLASEFYDNDIVEVLTYLKVKIEPVFAELIFMKNNKQQTFINLLFNVYMNCSNMYVGISDFAIFIIPILTFINNYLELYPSMYEKLLLTQDEDDGNIIHTIVSTMWNCDSMFLEKGYFIINMFDYLKEHSPSLFKKLITSRNRKQQTVLHILFITFVRLFKKPYNNIREPYTNVRVYYEKIEDSFIWKAFEYLKDCLDENNWKELLGARDEEGKNIFNILDENSRLVQSTGFAEFPF